MIARLNTSQILFTVAIVMLVCWCYNPLLLYFQNDDFVHIALSTKKHFLQHNSFRPVCDFSIMLDYWIWHKQSWGYHLTNLFLHIINSLLLYRVSIEFLRHFQLVKNPKTIAWQIALLFFAYAMHSEAVFWILGRSAALGGMFFLLSVLFYIKRKAGKYFLLSVVCIILSWLSYESTWILPFIILIISLIDVRLKKSELVKEWFFILFIWGFFGIYLLLRYNFTKQLIGNYEADLFIQGDVKNLAQHFAELIIRSWLPAMSNWKMLVAVFFIFVVPVVFFLFKSNNDKIRNFLVVCIACWLGSLIPFSSLGIDLSGTEAERFLYLPSFFVCIIICLLINGIKFSLVKYGLLFGMFCFHIIILFGNARNYKFAGAVVRTSMEQINLLSHSSILYVDNLPLQYRGTLIFRTGFKEAVAWMKHSQGFDSVNVLSYQVKDQCYTTEYKAEIRTKEIFSKQCKLNSGDFYWRYTDSSLEVFKQP